MAKKVVATLQTSGKDFARVIRMVKSQKTGAYTFKEKIVPNDTTLGKVGLKSLRRSRLSPLQELRGFTR